MKNKNFFILFIILSLFIIINNLLSFPGNILSWDVFGYYLYLPFKFIYHDIALIDDSVIYSIIDQYNNTSSFYQAFKVETGNYVMKYSMGMSFFYAPFFFIGHFVAQIFEYPTDGFSLPYQYSLFFGSMLYSIIGIWFLLKILTKFFSKKIVVIVSILIVFATNYIIHITTHGQNAMSHSYLFTAYTLILWFTILWHEKNKLKHIIFLGIICGVIILSRPTEIVCLFIPLFWNVTNKDSFKEKIQLLLKHKVQFLLFSFIIIGIGFCQLIYWKITTGSFLYNSYGANAGEGMDYFNPYILQILFSFRKGWLIYTPIMIFSIIGFFFLYKKNKTIFFALFFYFIANIYLVSCWSCWWYAQCFSQRALIPSYPIMAIALGYFIQWLFSQKKLLKYSISLIILLFLFLNLFQSRQIYLGVIHGDRMTKDYYFSVFMKMYATEEDKKLLLINRAFNGNEVFENENDYISKNIGGLDFEEHEKRDSNIVYEGLYSYKMDSTNIYSPSFEKPYYDITEKDHAWLRITAYVYPTKNTQEYPFSLIVHFSHKGYAYKYNGSDSEKMKLKTNEWNKISIDYLTPEVRRKKDQLKVYFWLKSNNIIYIDNIQVEAFEKK
jgi:Dolichyl-phosphate-mannose-protein mannosyltransferase